MLSSISLEISIMLVNKLKEIIGFCFGISFVLFLIHTFMSGAITYGINKIYSVFVSVLSILICGANVYITTKYFSDTKNRCVLDNELTCLGNQTIIKDIIFYSMISIHSLTAIYLLWRLPHLKIALKTAPFYYYLTRNKYIYLFQFIITILKIVLNSLFLVILAVQVSTGYNENFKVGKTFYVTETRSTYFSWINYIALGFIIFMWIFTTLIIKVVEQFFSSAIFSQWFFNKNKLWIKNLNVHILRQFKFHLGSFIKYALIIFWAHNFSVFLEKIKFYLDSIELAKKRHIILVVLLKPLVYMYERYFKYHNEQLIYDVTIFGRSVYRAGFRSYYLKFRNWSRFGAFYRGFGVHSIIGKLLLFNSIYLFVGIWITYIRSTFYDKIDFSVLSYLLYYPSIFGLYFIILFGEACSTLNTGYELLVYCFVSDEEMYQSEQKFCEEDLLTYMNSVSTANQKVYLKKIIAEQGVTKKLDEKFGQLIAKKVREEELDRFEDSNNQNEFNKSFTNDENKDLTLKINEPSNYLKAQYDENNFTEDDGPDLVIDNQTYGNQNTDGNYRSPSNRNLAFNTDLTNRTNASQDIVITSDERPNPAKFLAAKHLQNTNKQSMESVNEEVNLIEYIKRKKEKIKQQNYEFLKDKKDIEQPNVSPIQNDTGEYLLDPNSIAATMLKQMKKKPVKKEEEKLKVVIKNKYDNKE